MYNFSYIVIYFNKESIARSPIYVDINAESNSMEFLTPYFPFIKKMTTAKLQNSAIQSPQFGTVENPIAMMKHEHDNEGERFRHIAKLTDNYTPPSDACNTYKVTYAMLDEFEKDLHLHIHLENNILFPEAIKLELQFD